MLHASPSAPPAFAWDEWDAAVGGRTIRIEEAAEYMRKIREDQEPRFTGPVAPAKQRFPTPEDAARHLKEKALEFGADIVGICAIEPSDIYRGRTVTETYAVAVGQRMRWREFQVVPSRESAIECLRIYFTLGDSDLMHIPIGLKARFGELGRHGSIIHPTLGPLFRMGSVATSIDLAIDHPVDAGIAKFCEGAATKLFPQVVMHDAPPAVDGPDPSRRHFYMRLNR